MTRKTWMIALGFGLPWSLFMIFYYSFITGLTTALVISTLIGGLFAGLLFAFAMQFAGKWLFAAIKIELAAGESIVREAGANHFKGREGVGGKLVLTNRRLIFKSHRFNIQNHQVDFELGQIKKLEATKTMKLLDNGLTIELMSNESHKFIVDKSGEWVEVIMKQES